jgi:hypothetical protein
MKKLLCILLITPSWLFAGNLWRWAPHNWTYTDDQGRTSQSWEWAPGHITTTTSDGRRIEAWEWAPGNWSIEGD